VTDATAAPARARRGTDRSSDVARAALECFSNGGYRLTQIAHVAARLGVSVGSIYRYVDSKEALFHLAVLETLGGVADAQPAPLSVKGLEDTAALLRREIAREGLWPVLAKAARAPAPGDLRREAETIGGELYDIISARARIIRLLDRCAHEAPGLAEVFDDEVRYPLMADLVAWVVRRGYAPEGSPADAEALARGAMEAVAWLAKNRPSDPTAAAITDEQARRAAVRIFSSAVA
jgi:AcrR family transcriptional regulator